MSNVWDTLIDIRNIFISEFNDTGDEVFEPGMEQFNKDNWTNRTWQSTAYRRAHLDVVDARTTRGLLMMHCCVFPHTHNPAPIFGFDVIAGKSKITGCFYDYSPTVDTKHPLCDWFAHEASQLEWLKSRKLPEWATRIFSSNIVTAGNVSNESELEQITNMAKEGIAVYLNSVSDTNNTIVDCSKEQNYYCENQKQNPHTAKVMMSLGLSESDVNLFVQQCLFPEIK